MVARIFIFTQVSHAEHKVPPFFGKSSQVEHKAGHPEPLTYKSSLSAGSAPGKCKCLSFTPQKNQQYSMLSSACPVVNEQTGALTKPPLRLNHLSCPCHIQSATCQAFRAVPTDRHQGIGVFLHLSLCLPLYLLVHSAFIQFDRAILFRNFKHF